MCVCVCVCERDRETETETESLASSHSMAVPLISEKVQFLIELCVPAAAVLAFACDLAVLSGCHPFGLPPCAHDRASIVDKTLAVPVHAVHPAPWSSLNPPQMPGCQPPPASLLPGPHPSLTLLVDVSVSSDAILFLQHFLGPLSAHIPQVGVVGSFEVLSLWWRLACCPGLETSA